jgi:hypothetical protein
MALVIWMMAPFEVGYRRLGFPPSTAQVGQNNAWQYCKEVERFLQPLTDDMLMIDPWPAFLISGMAWRHMRTMLVTLMRKSLSQACMLILVASPIAPPTPTAFEVSRNS